MVLKYKKGWYFIKKKSLLYLGSEKNAMSIAY